MEHFHYIDELTETQRRYVTRLKTVWKSGVRLLVWLQICGFPIILRPPSDLDKGVLFGRGV